MTGFLGTVARASPARSTELRESELAAALKARGASTLDRRSGPSWFVGVANRGRPADTWFGDAGFAVLHGAPRVVGHAGLAAAARARGLAAACAEEYAAHGTAFLENLLGPFALAMCLERQGKTLLAVDRLGVFSIYYEPAAERLAFANQLALLSAAGVGGDLDHQAIYDYLFFHVIPGPRTVFASVRRLPPATFFERSPSSDKCTRYWNIRFENEQGSIDFAAYKREFVDLLKTGVGEELASARSPGCFLSGGTDSSTLAGMASVVGTEPARTYSIGFDQRGFDEIGYARIAARHFGTRHKEYYVHTGDIVRLATSLADVYGQPFGNSSVIPTFCCAEMARADGVETMLGGDGGDELFGGNTRYATQVLFSYYDDLPVALRRYVLEPLAFRLPGASKIMPVRKLGRYIEQARVPMPDRLQTYNYLNLVDRSTLFDDEFAARIDTGEPARAFAEEYRRSEGHSILNKMMALDWKYTLADNDVPKVTEMCDAAGVDVVFPFLRQEIVDFAARLPARQKVNRLRLRHFFKKALGDFLPQEIIRKKKHGFGMPFGDWLIAPGPLRELAFDSMSSLRNRGIVRASFLDELCSTRLREHPNYYGGFMWVLMVLELWLQGQGRAGRV